MRTVVIGTAGHIDHGKSALVRALTGTDPDRLKEEKARGITIDLGFAHLQDGDLSLSFVDVPGHERFVKNMLAGVGGTDMVMLVVAADESVMPQTREHFEICRLLRVAAGVIALTKSDLADRETLDLAALEVREMVKGSFLDDAPIVPVSSLTGDGLDALRAAFRSLAGRLPARQSAGPVRLPIDRVFSMKGFGTVVTGTLVAGTVRDGQALVALPRGLDVSVRGVQVHGRRGSAASAGQRVAANLGGVEIAELGRGDTLCDRGAFEATRRLDALIELLPDAPALRHGARIRFHHGTSELFGRVALAGEAPDRQLYARVRLESAAVVTRGDRFILRAYSPLATIGGGVVLDPHPPRGAIRTEEGLSRFRRLSGDVDSALAVFVDEHGAAGLPASDLVSRAGLSYAASAGAIERLVAAGIATRVGDGLLVSPGILAGLGVRLVDALEAHHARHPLSDGLPREEARVRLFRRAPAQVFELVLDRLVSEQRLVARDRLALQGHQVSLSGEESRAHGAIERIYRESKLTPPDPAAAAASAGAPRPVVDRVIALMLRTRTLVKVDTLVFHAEALEELKAEVRGLKRTGVQAQVDIATFKSRYGITRKFAIPLLEYLDRERVTRRVGESRIVL